MLRAARNHISDLGPLKSLQAPNTLDVQGNAITTLAPIVGAPWLGYDDIIFVADNPLDAETIEVIIPALCAAGVSVQ